MSSYTLLQALHDLHDSDLERREAAMSAIQEIANAEVASSDVRTVIFAASGELPEGRFAFNSYDGRLLQSMWPHVGAEHVSDLLSQAPKLSERGRAAALAALARIGTAEAAASYMDLLRRFGWPSEAYPAMTQPFEQDPRFASALLSGFVDGSIQGLPHDVTWGLLLAYSEAGSLPNPVGHVARPLAVLDAEALIAQLAPFQQSDGAAWRWEDAYLDLKYRAGRVFDLLGHLSGTPQSVAVLRAGERLSDPRPRMFAALSLLRLGEIASQDAIAAVATDPETRNILLDRLAILEKTSLFPKSQLDQGKLAESDMVNWLTFPTELGRAPDEIELMATVERDLGLDAGLFVYYVFRFRTYPPHWSAEDGWTAGVAGPFRHEDFPTTASWGDTFSTFTKWDDFTPEEHVSSIEELMQRWREHHARD